MPSRFVLILAGLALLTPGAVAGEDVPAHTLGACGGAMTGYDGQQYTCDADRKPACEPDGQRCRCLEQLACGGQRDEPF